MIRKFQRQDLEAAVKIWLAANKEAHDFIDPCYWEGYKDAVKEMFLQAEIYVFETEDMMEEIFDETGGILGFIGLDKDYVEGIFVRGDVRSQSIGKQLLDFVKQKRKRLELNVYVKNKRAVQFYEREGFCIQREGKRCGNREKRNIVCMDKINDFYMNPEKNINKAYEKQRNKKHLLHKMRMEMEHRNSVLIVEDDVNINGLLKRSIRKKKGIYVRRRSQVRKQE